MLGDALADDVMLIDAEGVCARLSIGVSHLHAMRRAGKFPLAPVHLGRAVRWKTDDLVRWVSAGCPAADRWRMLQQGGVMRRTGAA
jgi:predicted DNA-binding transcriptional regulator AlpA